MLLNIKKKNLTLICYSESSIREMKLWLKNAFYWQWEVNPCEDNHFLPRGSLIYGSLKIADGVIEEILPFSQETENPNFEGHEVIDIQGKLILPGLVG